MAPKPRRLGPKRAVAAAASNSQRARVCLRIRPALSEEEGGLQNMGLHCDREQQLAWAMDDSESQGQNEPRQFMFDHLLEQHSSQVELYDHIGAPAVEAARGGGTGCLICFGAGGAGKEYSMRCERPGQEGLFPRTLSALLPGSASAGAATPRPRRTP